MPMQRRKYLQQAPGAGTEVQHRLERPLADQLQQGRLDGPVGRVQRADFVPARRVGAEIISRPRLPAALHRGETLEVALHLRIGVVQPPHQALDEIARRLGVGQPEEGPGPFLVAADQPGFEQKLEMTRDARL